MWELLTDVPEGMTPPKPYPPAKVDARMYLLRGTLNIPDDVPRSQRYPITEQELLAQGDLVVLVDERVDQPWGLSVYRPCPENDNWYRQSSHDVNTLLNDPEFSALVDARSYVVPEKPLLHAGDRRKPGMMALLAAAGLGSPALAWSGVGRSVPTYTSRTHKFDLVPTASEDRTQWKWSCVCGLSVNNDVAGRTAAFDNSFYTNARRQRVRKESLSSQRCPGPKD